MLQTNIALSGADYFLHAIDREMRKRANQGYTCRFALTFARPIDIEQLQSRINSNAGIIWIFNARMKRRWPFRLPIWQSLVKLPPVVLQHDCEPNESWFNTNICDQNTPIRIDYFTPNNQLFVSWSHTLMDAHGGETLIKSLCQGSSDDVIWTAKPRLQRSFLEQLNQAKEAKNFVLEKAKGEILACAKERNPTHLRTSYRVIDFTAEETAKISMACTKAGANFRKSVYYLSCCTLATYQSLNDGKSNDEPVLVPVPQDQRRRGAKGPVISNQVAFMFYRFDSQILNDLPALVESASFQMMDQMRRGTIDTYATMMDLFRWVPLSLYARLIKGPTNGRMASFYFSDTGDSLRDLDTFGDVPILSATHYPPNSYPPGLTIVFGVFKGRLSVSVGYLSSLYSIDKLNEFEQTLRSALLGNTC